MKRTLLSILLILVLAFEVFALASCSIRHKHNFGDWKNHNVLSSCEDQLYYRVCSGCSDIEWRDGSYEDHDFEVVTTPPTCKDGGYDTKTCKNCETVEICNETPEADHSYSSEYNYDDSFHWHTCTTCPSTTDKTEHFLGDDGNCPVCDAVVGATEGLVYELYYDYAALIAYEGTADRIKIAEEYMGVPVTVIRDGVFYKNNSITYVIISDSVTSIGDHAFYSCDNLTSVVIGDSVTSIGFGAFYNCSSLTSVVIPDSVTSIGHHAFQNCNNLTSAVIPDSITFIGYCAFYYCNSLTSVVIPDGVTAIDELTFAYCSSLTSVVIPDSVTSIGDRAFYKCSSLKDVYYTGSEEDWAEISIRADNNVADATIHYNYVPEE